MENKIYGGLCTALSGLNSLESKYRFPLLDGEYLPYAKNTTLEELSEIVKPDSDGSWKHPIYICATRHAPTIGISALCKKAHEFLQAYSLHKGRLDILSICCGLQGDKLSLVLTVRFYSINTPDFSGLWDYTGSISDMAEETSAKYTLYEDSSCKMDDEYRNTLSKQAEFIRSIPSDVPLLNQMSSYTRQYPSETENIYDLRKKDMETYTLLPYTAFIDVFRQCMEYITSVERDSYYAAIKDVTARNQFWTLVDSYINRNIINSGKMTVEDYPALRSKLNRALFDLYIVRDLIDDPAITDIKICSPSDIRVRIHGKAYCSNVTFLDQDDYERFVKSLAVRNNINLDHPTQTFTDEKDDGYLLRFTLTSSYITSTGYPIIHIRKVSRKKLLGQDLIKAGMFDEKVMNYLLDCGRSSRGVVFAGPPGSGKTVALNWFLEEAYEPSAEILVIQESDELFTSRNGVMIEHVVTNAAANQMECSLEDLGKQALVAGAGVFVIGEAKGGEICSAITLSNSGCRTALTIHSPSAEETIDKMADLALRGYATSFEQAKRMMQSFETIVYLRDFKVQEISQIVSYDDASKDMIYRKIYSRGA